MDEVKVSKNGVFVPMEIADAITLETLKDALQTIQDDLEKHKNGEWMHAEDFKLNHQLIPAFEKLIWYFGG